MQHPAFVLQILSHDAPMTKTQKWNAPAYFQIVLPCSGRPGQSGHPGHKTMRDPVRPTLFSMAGAAIFALRIPSQVLSGQNYMPSQ